MTDTLSIKTLVLPITFIGDDGAIHVDFAAAFKYYTPFFGKRTSGFNKVSISCTEITRPKVPHLRR
eukprot:scaffold10310_cov171-Amphora_coffeaeformis.AAC.9